MMMTQPRYPDVRVKLSGEDGNAFVVLGRVARALRAAGVPRDEVELLWAEGTSGDYDHLVRVVAEWVTVGDDDDGEVWEWATDADD
jgi:hypothetical protein